MSLFSSLVYTFQCRKSLSWDLTISVYSFAVGKSQGLYTQIVSLLPSPSSVPHHLKGKQAAQCFPTSLPAPFSHILFLFLLMSVWVSLLDSHSSVIQPNYVLITCLSIWISFDSQLLDRREFRFNSHGESLSEYIWFKLQIIVIMRQCHI